MLGDVYNAAIIPKLFTGLLPRHGTCVFGRQLRRFNQDYHNHYEEYGQTLKYQNSARYLIPTSPEKFQLQEVRHIAASTTIDGQESQYWRQIA